MTVLQQDVTTSAVVCSKGGLAQCVTRQVKMLLSSMSSLWHLMHCYYGSCCFQVSSKYMTLVITV